jgi:hypothetical protein
MVPVSRDPVVVMHASSVQVGGGGAVQLLLGCFRQSVAEVLVVTRIQGA